jgi:hypothetical protein
MPSPVVCFTPPDSVRLGAWVSAVFFAAVFLGIMLVVPFYRINRNIIIERAYRSSVCSIRMKTESDKEQEKAELKKMLKSYSEIVKALSPLPEERRIRVIKAVAIILGIQE